MEENSRGYFELLRKNTKKFTDDDYILTESLLDSPKTRFSKWSETNFEKDRIVAANHGGIVAVQKSSDIYSSGISDIELYDNKLDIITRIEGKQSKNIIGFYLTPEEMLICVYGDSTVCIYNQRGQLIISKVTIEGADQNIIDVAFWENGCFLVTFTNKVFIIEDFSSLKASEFAEFEDYITNIAACPPGEDSNNNQHGPILWGSCTTGSNNDERYSLVCIQKDNVTVMDVPARVDGIVFSARYENVALIMEDCVNLYTSDFQMAHCELKTIDISITSAAWMGDSILLLTVPVDDKSDHYDENVPKTRVVTVGVTNEVADWMYEGGVFLKTEVDGARVITQTDALLFRRIPNDPDSTEDVLAFVMNEVKQSAGFELFKAVSDRRALATSDPLQKLVDDGSLPRALSMCMQAAQFFTSGSLRHHLLEVAAKSKDRDASFDVAEFKRAVSDVRVCDVLRGPPVGMPLTVRELEALRTERLLVRLCNRFQHFFAFRVAEYLGEKTENIYEHWCHCLVRSSAAPERVMELMRNNQGTIDYIELAQVAFQIGKQELGNMLLAANPVPSRCVPLYLQRRQWGDAVKAAVDSSDESLLIYVLKRAMDAGEDELVRESLARHDIALAAWLMFRPNDPNRFELLAAANRPMEAVNGEFDAAVSSGASVEPLLARAKQVKDDFGVATIEHYLGARSAAAGKYEVGPETSADEIMKMCIVKGDRSTGTTVAKKSGLSKDDYMWRKVTLFLETHNEVLIKDITKNGSREVNLAAFEGLCDDGQKELAAKYIELVKDQDVRLEIAETCGLA